MEQLLKKGDVVSFCGEKGVIHTLDLNLVSIKEGFIKFYDSKIQSQWIELTELKFIKRYELADREQELLNLIQKGHKMGKCSKLMNVDARTVSTLINRVKKKLDLHKDQNLYTTMKAAEKYLLLS